MEKDEILGKIERGEIGVEEGIGLMTQSPLEGQRAGRAAWWLRLRVKNEDHNFSFTLPFFLVRWFLGPILWVAGKVVKDQDIPAPEDIDLDWDDIFQAVRRISYRCGGTLINIRDEENEVKIELS